MDDFEKEFPNFDWKETPSYKHPKKCRCPRCEHFKERIKTGGFPIIIRLCPPHYDAYWETFDEAYKRIPFLQRMLYRMMVKLKMILVQKLKHMEAELCFWCKFGSGGRGIKKPLAPDMP